MLLKVLITFRKTLSKLQHWATLSAVRNDDEPKGTLAITWHEKDGDTINAIEFDNWKELESLYHTYQPSEITITTTNDSKGVEYTLKHEFEYLTVMRHKVAFFHNMNTFEEEEEDSGNETDDYVNIWHDPKANSEFWDAATRFESWETELKEASRALTLRPLIVGQTCPVDLHEPLVLGKTYLLPCQHLISLGAWEQIGYKMVEGEFGKECPQCRRVVNGLPTKRAVLIV